MTILIVMKRDLISLWDFDRLGRSIKLFLYALGYIVLHSLGIILVPIIRSLDTVVNGLFHIYLFVTREPFCSFTQLYASMLLRNSFESLYHSLRKTLRSTYTQPFSFMILIVFISLLV